MQLLDHHQPQTNNSLQDRNISICSQKTQSAFTPLHYTCQYPLSQYQQNINNQISYQHSIGKIQQMTINSYFYICLQTYQILLNLQISQYSNLNQKLVKMATTLKNKNNLKRNPDTQFEVLNKIRDSNTLKQPLLSSNQNRSRSETQISKITFDLKNLIQKVMMINSSRTSILVYKQFLQITHPYISVIENQNYFLKPTNNIGIEALKDGQFLKKCLFAKQTSQKFLQDITKQYARNIVQNKSDYQTYVSKMESAAKKNKIIPIQSSLQTFQSPQVQTKLFKRHKRFKIQQHQQCQPEKEKCQSQIDQSFSSRYLNLEDQIQTHFGGLQMLSFKEVLSFTPMTFNFEDNNLFVAWINLKQNPQHFMFVIVPLSIQIKKSDLDSLSQRFPISGLFRNPNLLSSRQLLSNFGINIL